MVLLDSDSDKNTYEDGKETSVKKPVQRYVRFLIILVVIGSASTINLAGITNCNPVFACECTISRSVGDEFSEARAVFSGKVTSITDSTIEGGKIVSLDVGRAWKGVSNDTDAIAVRTWPGTATCGFPFEENREYLVYAYGTDGEISLAVELCSRTAPIENAQTDLAFLDPSYVPVSDGGNPIQSNGALVIGTEYLGLVGLVIGFGAAIAGVLAFLLRPLKRN